jgi:hypothetical protein
LESVGFSWRGMSFGRGDFLMEMEPFVFRHEGSLVEVRRTESPTEGGDGGGIRASVNRFALRPLEEGEFSVFALDLCHNQIDRHFSRFPDEELDKVNAMVPGRP